MADFYKSMGKKLKPKTTSRIPDRCRFGIVVGLWGHAMLVALMFSGASGDANAQFLNRSNDAETTPTDPGFPTPKKAKVKVLKGQQASIELEAGTKSPASLVEFLIRDWPLAGKVESLDIKRDNHRVAVMKYTPKLNTAATTDTFTFSVRYPGGRWSAPAKVEIDLVDAVPIIEAPQVIEFGRVMIGDAVKRDVYLRNSGRAIFDKKLKLGEPFAVVDPPDGHVQIPIGGSKIIKMEYRPIQEGKSAINFTINRNGGGIPLLRGEGFAPFGIVGKNVKLELNKETGIREGEIVIASKADKVIMIKARPAERLLLSKRSNELYLSPGQELTVPVEVAEADSAALNASVDFFTEAGFIQKATVTAEQLPGRLEVEIPGADGGGTLLNFGDVLAGKSVQTGIVLKNVGGEPITVEPELPAPFGVLVSGSGKIMPKTGQPMAISFSPQKTDYGLFDEFLYLRTSTQEIKIRLLGISRLKESDPVSVAKMRMPGVNNSGMSASTPAAGGNNPAVAAASNSPGIGNGADATPANSASEVTEADRPPSTPAKVTSPLPVGPSGRFPKKVVNSLEELNEMRSITGFVTRALKQRTTAENLAPPTQFGLKKRGKEDLILQIQAPPDSEDHEFELELRGSLEDEKTGMLASVWIPYDNVTYRREGETVSAHIKGLYPNRTYEFRAFTINANGHSSVPSPQIITNTNPPMDWTYIYLGTALVGLALLIWGVIRVIKNRREMNSVGRGGMRYGY